MDARQMSAMAEATRLTRQGRLLEATALIQRTLASQAVTRPAPDAPWGEEETGTARGRYPDPPPALAAREGAQRGPLLPAGFLAAVLSPAEAHRVCTGRTGQRPRP